MSRQNEITELLTAWSSGNQAALDKLLPIVYQELRRLASKKLRSQRAGDSLQPTALVHEAYLKLINCQDVKWQNRAHFFGVAAQIMRNILVDHTRTQLAAKRGGGNKISLEDLDELSEDQQRENEIDLIALDDALIKLAQLDPQQSRIVELRYFGGLTIEEAAEVLHISPATIKREWALAKSWLFREINNRSNQ